MIDPPSKKWTDSALRPCHTPDCAGKPTVHHKYIMHEWKYRVECSLCTSDTSWFLDYEFAKNQWNYRPVEDALLARIAELEAKLIVVSRELTSTDNADRYYRGFNQGYDHAKALMQQRIAELEAALAERGEWQPIGDGTIDMDGDTIDILVINEDRWHMTVTEADDSQAMLIMPPDIRLCRQRPQPVVVDASEPNWSHAPSWARFWTRDDKGPTWWWETKPYYDGKMGIWICDDEGRRAIATDIPTLRQRPQPAAPSAVEATKG